MHTDAQSRVVNNHDSTETNEKIYKYLSSRRSGVLATVSPNHTPHAAAIYYSISPKFEISFITKQDTKKAHNITKNNRVILVVCDDAAQIMAQVIGKASDITHTPEAEDVFASAIKAAHDTSLSGVPPISKLNVGNYVAYRITPNIVRMADFSRAQSGSDPFEVAEL